MNFTYYKTDTLLHNQQSDFHIIHAWALFQKKSPNSGVDKAFHGIDWFKYY